MAIIYTYPSATPTGSDLLVFSDVSETDPAKATRKCSVTDIVNLIGALVPGGGTVTSVGLGGGTTGLTIATTTTNPITTTGVFTVGGTLVAANGGTGHTNYAVGDLIYASGATTLTKLVAGSNTHVLTLAGGVPTWAAPTTGTVTSVQVAGGSTGLTFSGGPITTTGTITMTGTLNVANGGTRRSTLTQHSILVGDGVDPIQMIGPMTNGQLLIGSTGAAPVANTLTAGTAINIVNGVGAIEIEVDTTLIPANNVYTANGTISGTRTIINGGELRFNGTGLATTTTFDNKAGYGFTNNASVTVDASAVIQADSTTKGFLPPRMTTVQMNAIGSPATGLMVYDTTTNQWMGNNGTPGAPNWVIIG